MIPADSFMLDGDTALVVVECPPDSAPAVWEQADKPCDICGGSGYPNNELPICPDCDGTGHHAFDIEVECDKWIKGYHCWSEVFRVHVIDVLPIIDVPDTGYPHPKPEQFAYTSKAGSLRVVDCSAQTDTYISKPPPDAAPGKWLVRLKVPT